MFHAEHFGMRNVAKVRSEQQQLPLPVAKEMDTSLFPEKAQEVLRKMDPLVNYYHMAGNGVREVSLYKRDWITLQSALKKTKQNPTCTYRGMRIVLSKT